MRLRCDFFSNSFNEINKLWEKCKVMAFFFFFFNGIMLYCEGFPELLPCSLFSCVLAVYGQIFSFSVGTAFYLVPFLRSASQFQAHSDSPFCNMAFHFWFIFKSVICDESQWLWWERGFRVYSGHHFEIRGHCSISSISYLLDAQKKAVVL